MEPPAPPDAEPAHEIERGYSPLDGYGFINAERAVNAVLKD
jgi:hypothetical protein